MGNRNNLYIPSIDAKDLCIARNLKNGYTLRRKDGKYNLKRFVNSFDYSLDLIELRDVAKEVYAGKHDTLSFVVDDKELYLIGASLKDLGRKCFGFTKMDKGEIRRIKKEAFGAGRR